MGEDQVEISVAAYSGDPEQYRVEHGQKMLDQVERFAGRLPSGGLVLDAGCGPGRDLARFAERGLCARGVDLNPEFVAMAAAHAPAQVCDLRELHTQCCAGEFDGVWACASLVHLPDVQVVGVLAAFHRILRPGGVLYACVKAFGETGWLDEADGRRWYEVWRPEVFAARVAAAGFTVEDVVDGPFAEVWATRCEPVDLG